MRRDERGRARRDAGISTVATALVLIGLVSGLLLVLVSVFDVRGGVWHIVVFAALPLTAITLGAAVWWERARGAGRGDGDRDEWGSTR